MQTIKQREESLRRRIYQILETYSESIGISSIDISKMIPAYTPVSDLLDYLSDVLRSFAHKLSSQLARDIVKSSPSPTSVAKKVVDTSSEMSTVPHDDIGDSLMLSPDYDISNESSSIDVRNPMQTSSLQAISTHQQLQKLIQQQSSKNLPSYQSDYGVNTSKEIQQRLLKAQQAINSMKTYG